VFDQMTKASRGIVTQAQAEAHGLGARSIEAEHLLVALASSTSAAGAVLSRFGLSADQLRDLILQERARSLGAVGITAEPPAPTSGALRLSTPAKAVLRRAVGASRGRISEATLLTAVLDQEAGTVPRLLSLAGVDKSSLLQALNKNDRS
jgi:ATP-dependent Clp protease ATP-binding subunit ClpA